MIKIFVPVLFVVMMVVNVSAINVNKDTINFTDTSQFLCIINNSNSIVTLDTIKINMLTSRWIGGLTIDSTSRNIFRSPCIGDYGPYIVRKNDSTYIAPANIVIKGNDSIKLYAIRFMGCCSGCASKILDQKTLASSNVHVDTINLVFTFSNSDTVSVYAIIDHIVVCSKVQYYPQQIVSSSLDLEKNTYLLNGKQLQYQFKINKHQIIIDKQSKVKSNF